MRPRSAENLGAVARAMRNFGLRRWAWVDPNPKLAAQRDASRRLAVHAEDLLDQVELHPSLDSAVAGCAWVVGTSMRHLVGRRSLSPRQVAEEAVVRAGAGAIALVFGDERSGLTNVELQRCHDLSAIPTAPEQPSLNLAQAVLVYGYELALAAKRPSSSGPLPTAATHAELQRLEQTLREVLRASGFLRAPERHAVADLLLPLVRSRLSRKEARLWMAALHALGAGRAE